jgi:leucyl-tRNA synthetase
VHRFLKKFWRLFFTDDVTPLSGRRGVGGEAIWNDDAASNEELKVLHKTIKKIEEDTERFSFNTGVSAFMIATNELTDLKCHKRSVLEPLLILLSPYAPHVCEELWHSLGHSSTVLDEQFPVLDEKYLLESSKEYPVSINGKLRTTINISLDASQEEAEKIVMANEVVKKWLENRSPKKIIYVKGKMLNVVV